MKHIFSFTNLLRPLVLNVNCRHSHLIQNTVVLPPAKIIDSLVLYKFSGKWCVFEYNSSLQHIFWVNLKYGSSKEIRKHTCSWGYIYLRNMGSSMAKQVSMKGQFVFDDVGDGWSCVCKLCTCFEHRCRLGLLPYIH